MTARRYTESPASASPLPRREKETVRKAGPCRDQ